MAGDGLAEIVVHLIEGIALGETARQVGDLGPVAPLLLRMDHCLEDCLLGCGLLWHSLTSWVIPAGPAEV